MHRNEARKTDTPVGMGEIILYNLSGSVCNLYDTVLYAWVAYFYIPPEGLGRVQYLPLGAMGLILFGGRILDAVTDPLIGYLSDRTKSRWGRRKPYLFLSYPILLVSFLFIWRPPVQGVDPVNILFLVVVLFFYYVSYTGVLIPWFALLPEMSRDNTERVKIAAVGVAIGVVLSLAAGGLSGPIFSRLGAFQMALVFGLLGFVLSEIGFFGVKERRGAETPDEKTPGFFTTLSQMFGDKQVLSFAVMITFVQLTYQLLMMNVPYLTTLILGLDEGSSSIILGEVIGLMALTVPLWYLLLDRFPKRHVFRGLIVTMIIGFILSFFIGRYPIGSPLVQAMIVIPIAAIPMGGMFTAVLGIISDLTDYDELKSGRRREAIYFGIYGIVRKTGWAFSSLILTGVFALFGYSPDNPLGVRMIFLVCACSCLLGLLAFIPYYIGDSSDETRRILARREAEGRAEKL